VRANIRNLASVNIPCPKASAFALFMLALSFAYSCQPSLQEVLQAEKQRFAATVARDTTRLRAGLHPDLVYIHSNGLEESATDFITSVASARIEYDEFEALTPVKLEPFGKTVLADGLVRVHGRYHDNPFNVDLRYTSVYRRSKGRWQLVRWQSTQIE